MDVEKLVRMANQIAANFDYGPDKDKVVTGIAEHLKRYWTPSMLTLIIEGQRRDAVDLSEVAGRAVAKLAEQNNSAA
jgi:formate dehydrogenase subunit delta